MELGHLKIVLAINWCYRNRHNELESVQNCSKLSTPSASVAKGKATCDPQNAVPKMQYHIHGGFIQNHPPALASG